MQQIPWSAQHLDYPEDQHTARMIVNDPKAHAWAWIWSYAQSLSRDSNGDWYEGSGTITADELIETAMENLDSTSQWGGEYISKGGLLEGISTDPTFWDKLAILKDLEIPQEKRNNFFTCSC